MATGWIKLHRSAESHPVLRNATRRGLFDRLLLRAAREAVRVSWRGNTIGLDVGQLAISVREFAEENELSYKETRLHLQRLEVEGMISLAPILGARKGAGKGAIGSLVTICNFSKFQLSENSRGAIEGAVEGAAGAQWGRTEQEAQEFKNKTPPTSSSVSVPAREAAAAEDGFADLVDALHERTAPAGVTRRGVHRVVEGWVGQIGLARTRTAVAEALVSATGNPLKYAAAIVDRRSHALDVGKHAAALPLPEEPDVFLDAMLRPSRPAPTPEARRIGHDD